MTSRSQAIMLAILRAMPGPEWREETDIIYSIGLSDIPDEAAERLTKEIIRSCRMRPSPAEIRSLYASLWCPVPGPEQAWAMMPKDESDTVVWTEEMREAYAYAASLLEAGDRVAARVTFIETYKKLVDEGVRAGKRPRWSVSLGTDRTRHAVVIAEAVRQGRLSLSSIANTFPHLVHDDAIQAILPPGSPLALPADDRHDERSNAMVRRIVENRGMEDVGDIDAERSET